jgi:hypothetical protein
MNAEAEEWGITATPPPVIRWITEFEALDTQSQCLRDQGLEVKVDRTRSAIDYRAPGGGNEQVERLAWWVCEWKYPRMPDREHGELSDRRKGIMYDYIVDELIPCLAEYGYIVSDVPSYEVFWERYATDTTWLPYNDALAAWASANEINIEAYCPQWPTDGRLDWLYEEDE